MPVGKSQADAHGTLGALPDRRRAETMGFEQILRGGPCTLDIALATRWVHAEHIAAETEALRLIDGAGVTDQVAKRRRYAVAVPLEQLRKSRRREAALVVEPHRQREVVKREDGRDPLLAAGGEHAPVVVERGARELALGPARCAPTRSRSGMRCSPGLLA